MRETGETGRTVCVVAWVLVGRIPPHRPTGRGRGRRASAWRPRTETKVSLFRPTRVKLESHVNSTEPRMDATTDLPKTEDDGNEGPGTSASSRADEPGAVLPLAKSLETTLALLLRRTGHLMAQQAQLHFQQSQQQAGNEKLDIQSLPGWRALLQAASRWQRDVKALGRWVVSLANRPKHVHLWYTVTPADVSSLLSVLLLERGARGFDCGARQG